MKLRLSEDYVIDTDDYRREGLRIAILAMSGHGKSNAAADVVEDVLGQKGQAIILEPIAEWHTLKARYNNVVTDLENRILKEINMLRITQRYMIQGLDIGG